MGQSNKPGRKAKVKSDHIQEGRSNKGVEDQKFKQGCLYRQEEKFLKVYSSEVLDCDRKESKSTLATIEDTASESSQ